MEFQPVKPDLVKYEMRMVEGENPYQKEQKRPGAFARFMSGAGKVLGSMAMPMSLIFPPAAIGAAGMYGMGAIGDQMQQRIYVNELQKMQQQSMTSVSFPGLGVGPGGVQPAAGSVPAADEQVMGILFQRNNAMLESAHGL